MSVCKCGSHAINDHLHGRVPGHRLDLCDVCYWHERAIVAEADATRFDYEVVCDRGEKKGCTCTRCQAKRRHIEALKARG